MGKHIVAPRPPNAWILYRSDKLKSLPPVQPGVRRAQAEVSRMLSDMWKEEGEETRSYYERLADEKKAEHSIKYPGYRFQPMKKEEKAALREQKKYEKGLERRARQQQQQRNRSDQPPSSSQPAVPLDPSTVVLLPPLPAPHGYPSSSSSVLSFAPAPHTFLYPVMPHMYHPMDFYGSAGPSPPLSLASSPLPDSEPETGSDESHDLEAQNDSTQPSDTAASAAALPSLDPPPPPPAAPAAPALARTGTNPYLAILGPAATQKMFPAPTTISIPPFVHTPLSVPMSAVSETATVDGPSHPQYVQPDNGQSTMDMDRPSETTSIPESTPASQLAFTDHMADDYNFEGLTFQPFENQQLSFNVSESFFNQVGELHSEGSHGHSAAEAMRHGEDIFALSNFDNTVSDVSSDAELLVQLGQFGQQDDFDFGSFINHGMLDSIPTSHPPFEHRLEPQVQEARENEPLHLLELIREGLHSGETSPSTASHPSMPPTPASGQVALSVDLSNTGNGCRATQGYTPPPGAVHFAVRRPAGSWKAPQFSENESTVDELSPCHSFGVSNF